MLEGVCLAITAVIQVSLKGIKIISIHILLASDQQQYPISDHRVHELSLIFEFAHNHTFVHVYYFDLFRSCHVIEDVPVFVDRDWLQRVVQREGAFGVMVG